MQLRQLAGHIEQREPERKYPEKQVEQISEEGQLAQLEGQGEQVLLLR